MAFNPTTVDKSPFKDLLLKSTNESSRFEGCRNSYYFEKNGADREITNEYRRYGIDVAKFSDGRGANNIYLVQGEPSLEMAARLGAVFIPSAEHLKSIPVQSRLPNVTEITITPSIQEGVSIVDRLAQMNIVGRVSPSGSVTINNPAQIAAVAIAGASVHGVDQLIRQYCPEHGRV